MDWERLEREAKKRGWGNGRLARQLGMNESTYYRKRRKGVELTVSEMRGIVEALELTETDTKAIFMDGWKFGQK